MSGNAPGMAGAKSNMLLFMPSGGLIPPVPFVLSGNPVEYTALPFDCTWMGVFVDPVGFIEDVAERAESCRAPSELRPEPIPGAFSDVRPAARPILKVPAADKGTPHFWEEVPKAPLPANCIPNDSFWPPPADCPPAGAAETTELVEDPTVAVAVTSETEELMPVSWAPAMAAQPEIRPTNKHETGRYFDRIAYCSSLPGATDPRALYQSDKRWAH
jgi:hypothetical protein